MSTINPSKTKPRLRHAIVWTKAKRAEARKRELARMKLAASGPQGEMKAFGINYIPTPADIDRECRLIQSNWSDEERKRRAGIATEPIEIFVTTMDMDHRRVKPAN